MDHASGFTEKDILQEMDKAFNNVMGIDLPQGGIQQDFFLDLEDTRIQIAGSKIHVYGDSLNWAVVFETNGYSMGSGFPETCLVYLGNCIEYAPIHHAGNIYNYFNLYYLVLFNSLEELLAVESKMEGVANSGFIKKDLEKIKIKGQWVYFKNDYRELEKWGITVWDYRNPDNLIDFTSLIRYLHETQPEVLWAKENEIREHLTADIPKLLEIDKFHFSSYYDKHIPPSSQELYQLIARVIVTRDPSAWQPTQEPNNHWSNWDSGFF